MAKSKIFLVIVCLFSVLLSFSACSMERLTHKTYTGKDRPSSEVAIFNWSGTWYMGLALYKVDGRPFTEGFKGGTWECMYNNKNVGGFSVAVLPGKRVFEFFRVKSEPVSVFQVSFHLKAGKVYTLEGNEEKFVILCDGKEVKADVGQIPVYIEPLDKEPHGTLALDIYDDTYVIALFRIDGKAGKPMYKLHPKWVSINDLHSLTDEPDKLRFTPGKHSIEYVVLGRPNKFYGYSHMGSSVKMLTFNVKSGKSYSYKVIPDPDNGSSGRFEHTIEIVEK